MLAWKIELDARKSRHQDINKMSRYQDVKTGCSSDSLVGMIFVETAVRRLPLDCERGKRHSGRQVLHQIHAQGRLLDWKV